MIETGVYWTVIITLLGVAYPILLQVIAKIDEIYSSSLVVELFDEEPLKKRFKKLLVISLIISLIWSLKLKPINALSKLSYLLDNSAVILLIISSISLVISFILLVNKIITYYIPSKFVKYLIKKHREKLEKNKKDNELKYFKAIGDVLLYSINRNNASLTKTISNELYTEFRKIRDDAGEQPIVYPIAYYELVYTIIKELILLNNQRFANIQVRTLGSVLLLGEAFKFRVSEDTYNWMWRNLILAIQNERDDMVLDHWETAHQFISYSRITDIIELEYDPTNEDIKNKEVVDEKRKGNHKRFLEFHYALGGVLLYKKRYSCIKQIFSYTQSHPPKYDLLPENMTEIFQFYSEFRNPYNTKYIWISHLYPFPDPRGITSDRIIKKWISSYFTLLFLRQYSIIQYYIPTFPTIPKSQSEIKSWIDAMDFFEKLVTEHLNNKELLSATNLDFITPKWYNKNKKQHPIHFIKELKKKLEEGYEQNAKKASISENKVKQFEQSTKDKIEETVNNLYEIKNKEPIEGDTDKSSISGIRTLYQKDAFSKNKEIHYVDFNSFLASGLSDYIKYGVREIFDLKKTKTYLLKQEDLFRAVDKLKINSDYIIIAFHTGLDYYVNQLKDPKLTTEKYGDIDIIYLSNTTVVSYSLYVIKKSDLPNISTKEIDEKEIKEYSLKKISDDFNLYASIIDLNKASKEILNKHRDDKTEDEARKYVLMTISILIEVKWKKNINLVCLKEYSMYRQDGLPNDIEEVKAIEK